MNNKQETKTNFSLFLLFFFELFILHWNIANYAEGNGNPRQYSCLENPMDGGAW